MLANHIVKHIPGGPKAIVQYMPGAGGLKATNYLYNAAPKDGAMVATLFASLPSVRLFKPDAAKYEPEKVSWLGAFSRTVNFIIVNKGAAASFDELASKEVVIGSIGKGNTTYQFPALINGAFGTKLKIISGYRSGGAIYKAMEGGEVQGYAPVWLSVVATKAQALAKGDIKVLVQGGLTKLAALPDVPLLLDLAKTDEQRSMIRFLSAASPLGRAAQGPPGIPKARYEALVAGLAATVKDPAYLAEAKKLKLSVDFTSRDDTVAAVRQIMQTPPAVVANIKTAMGY
jgi:tripartite-type tricarboxylate transporter receptor subunit TctC